MTSSNTAVPSASDTRLIIWDFDGIFNKYTPAFGVEALKAMIASYRGRDRTPGKVKAVVDEFKSCSNWLEFRKRLEEKIKKLGDAEKHGDTLLKHIRDRCDTDFLKPDPALLEQLAKCDPGVINVVLTHSDRPWMDKLLKVLKLEDFFTRENVFCLEDIPAKKSHGTGAYEHVVNTVRARLGNGEEIPYDKVVTIDDKAKNLQQARNLGIRTVWVPAIYKPQSHRLLQEVRLPPGVQQVFHSTLEFISAFNGTPVEIKTPHPIEAAKGFVEKLRSNPSSGPAIAPSI